MKPRFKPTPWKAASGARGTRPWWVSRYVEGPHRGGEALEDSRGRVRTFATFRAAEQAAHKANEKP